MIIYNGPMEDDHDVFAGVLDNDIFFAGDNIRVGARERMYPSLDTLVSPREFDREELTSEVSMEDDDDARVRPSAPFWDDRSAIDVVPSAPPRECLGDMAMSISPPTYGSPPPYEDPPAYEDLFPAIVDHNDNDVLATPCQDDVDNNNTIQEHTVYVATVSEENKPVTVKLLINDNGIEATELGDTNGNPNAKLTSHNDCCFSKGKMYFSGGDASEKKFYSFEVGTNTPWKSRNSMKNKRCMHNLVSVGQNIYALGGFNHKTIALKSIEKYDPLKGEWHEDGKLLHGNWFMSAVSDSGKIYTFGGRSTKEPEDSRLVQCYDTATRETTRLPDLPFAVVEARAIVSGDNVFLVSFDKRVLRYNLTDYSCTQISESIYRKNFGVYTHGNYMYVVGGNSRTVNRLSMMVENAVWETVGSLPKRLKLVCACAVG